MGVGVNFYFRLVKSEDKEKPIMEMIPKMVMMTQIICALRLLLL